MSKTIYLYLKTHNKTKLRYLGKTVRNPFSYGGSGVRWKAHLNKHGDDVTTEILFQTKDKEEFERVALEYSEKWNIVESRQFANLKEESGDGGDTSKTPGYLKAQKERRFASYGMLGKTASPETRKKQSDAKKGKPTWNKGIPWSEEAKANMRKPHYAARGKVRTEEHRANLSKALKGKEGNWKGKKHSPETLEKMRETASKRKKLDCTHCGRSISINIFGKHHGDNCKKRVRDGS